MRSTRGRTGHSQGTTRSAAGSATFRRSTSPTGHRLTQRCPQPSERINTSRTWTRSTAVRAGAAGDRCPLRASESRTRSFVCTRTTCYHALGLQEGGPHEGCACFNMRNILRARQVRFHTSECATCKKGAGSVFAQFSFKHFMHFKQFKHIKHFLHFKHSMQRIRLGSPEGAPGSVLLLRVSIETNKRTNDYSDKGRPPLCNYVTGKICAVYAYCKICKKYEKK